MKRIRNSILGIIFIVVICNAAESEIILIANNAVPQTTITKSDVMLVFLGKKKKWDNGYRIRVCALKGGPVHEAFLDEYVNKTPAKYASFWKIAIVSGTAHPPKFFDSEEALIDYIKKSAGAIGYISSDTPHEDVKTLSIQ